MKLGIAVTGQALLHGPVSNNFLPSQMARFESTALAFANLEATGEAPGAWPTKTKTVHAASAAAIASLKTVGLTALGHANNHAFDLGPPGIAAARAHAAAAGFAFAGSGAGLSEAGRPAMVSTPAGRVAVIAADLGPQPEIVYAGRDRPGINPLRMRRRVTVPGPVYETLAAMVEQLGDGALQKSRAAVGYRGELDSDGIEVFGTPVVRGDKTASTFLPDREDLAALTASIHEARAAADLVLVCLHNHHWKADWGDLPEWFTGLGRTLIDEGADLIVGHGVPVLQPIVFHRERPIFGSLGNFIFHTERAAIYDREGVDVWSGALCHCRFEDGTCRAIDILPIAVGRPEPGADGLPPGPSVLTGKAAERVLERLSARLDQPQRDLLRLVS